MGNCSILINKWFNTGFFLQVVHHLSPGEAFALLKKGAIIIDLREDYLSAFKTFKVEKVIFLPFSQLGGHFKELPDEKPLIFADSVGLRSHEGVMFMNSHGYSNVANMAGGFVDWNRDGFQLNTDINSLFSKGTVLYT